MPTLIVRNVDDETKSALMCRAAANGRSMEAEIRQILKDELRPRGWVFGWLTDTEELQGDELDLPKRSLPRTGTLFTEILPK